MSEPLMLPLGRIMDEMGKKFLELLNQKLSHLDIDRSYYPLLLIEQGNGQLTQNDLARKLKCDKVQVVRIINYLSEKGYVERETQTSDRRKYGLQVTTKAQNQIPDIYLAVKEIHELAFTNISEVERLLFLELIEKIHQNLNQHNNTSIHEE